MGRANPGHMSGMVWYGIELGMTDFLYDRALDTDGRPPTALRRMPCCKEQSDATARDATGRTILGREDAVHPPFGSLKSVRFMDRGESNLVKRSGSEHEK